MVVSVSVCHVEKVSETIKVSKGTKRSLLKIAARLQEESGERVGFDEAIHHMASLVETKKPILLDKAFGLVLGTNGQDLYKERRFDEERA